MNQIAFPLDAMSLPLTADEKTVMERLTGWVPSGIGAMDFATIRHQTAWPFPRASAAVCALEERGLIWKGGPCGEFYVCAVVPKIKKEI